MRSILPAKQPKQWPGRQQKLGILKVRSFSRVAPYTPRPFLANEIRSTCKAAAAVIRAAANADCPSVPFGRRAAAAAAVQAAKTPAEFFACFLIPFSFDLLVFSAHLAVPHSPTGQWSLSIGYCHGNTCSISRPCFHMSVQTYSNMYMLYTWQYFAQAELCLVFH